MFLQVSVVLFTGGVPGPRGVSGSGGVPGPGGGCAYCCGRYASYWNAFLLDSVNTLLESDSIFIKIFKKTTHCTAKMRNIP